MQENLCEVIGTLLGEQVAQQLFNVEPKDEKAEVDHCHVGFVKGHVGEAILNGATAAEVPWHPLLVLDQEPERDGRARVVDELVGVHL